MNRVVITGTDETLRRVLSERLRRAACGVSELAEPAVPGFDARDPDSCRRAIEAIRPDAVVDCSGRGPVEPRRQIAGNLACAAAGSGALMIHLSCPDVFDGSSPGPYLESDAPAPATLSGKLRLAAEEGVALAGPRHAIVRTSWLYGPAPGSRMQNMLSQAQAGEVEADDYALGTPTFVPHLADALLTLLRRPAYGVFHLAGAGEPCTEAGFARALLRAARAGARVVPTTTPSGGVNGRVRNLALASCRDELPPLPEWRLGLASCLQAGVPV
jgi:dTDP-4-dehydrorhamnose reductase